MGKKLTWLYHSDYEPILVPLTQKKRLKKLADEGWKDSPAKVESKEPVDNLTAEQDVEDSEQLYSELLPRFRNDPESMTKEELLTLGRLLGVKLYKMWGETTLIKKINENLS